ncbi:rho GTPase-activating protein 1-like [Phyllobates terribilis]|uniref:rho GTPase-activating protein 1-like n=1 Tax=Phyllobates terribilis TaxID=111132 RepID=UPI003CCA8ED6
MTSEALSDLQDDLERDETTQSLDQLKLASLDDKNWPSDDVQDFPKSEDSKVSPDPLTHLRWDDPYYDIARHQIVEVAGLCSEQNTQGDGSKAFSRPDPVDECRQVHLTIMRMEWMIFEV